MTNNPQNLSPNKQALLKIRELKQQLADAQACTGEPIAIVSMACRFPRHAQTPEQFWQCLIDQTDEVGDIPDDRWDFEAFHDDDPEAPGKMYARRGVFLDNLDLMDPEFFGISPREATWVDPQQRLLLEVGWEALERAGWPAEKIGEQTGIFVGWMHNDYQNEASDSFLNLNPYIATGAAGSFLCGRLAYYLGLQGPSVAVDTACSSSLVALHLAIQSLQRRDCDRALVGGVNAICSPTTNILTCKLKALSPTGQSRAFDAAADGYLRGEGCGVVTLRRLSDARLDNDPILGIIRGSAVGHNGFSSGLTAPNPKAQEKVIRQALQKANISPEQVAYLEAHGTGTELGDPIEMQAAAAALAENRSADQPLLVGSVKTNIGHLEAAAGMAGLIKVLLSMQNQQIPGQLNFEVPNPHIPWEKIHVKVLTQLTEWPDSKQRIAGVSAFGMSGTNAHVVIEAPVDQERATAPNSSPFVTERPQGVSSAIGENGRSHRSGETADTDPQLIVLSGKSEEALYSLAEKYEAFVAADAALTPQDIAFTTSACRSHHEQRAALVVKTRSEVVEGCRTLARAGSSNQLFVGSARRRPKVAWQFTGQGAQYVGMSQELYERQPVFRNAIDDCESLIQQRRNESLIEVLFHDENRVDHTSWTQPAIFAVQMGLSKLLQSWGLEPDVVFGHSVGQFAAACVAGIMSWEHGLHLISERGRLIGDLPMGGRMLAVFAPLVKVKQTMEACSEVSLAALNGTHIVISGPADSIAQAEANCSEQGIRTRALTTSHAFHSSLMEPALEPFEEAANEITFQRPHLPLICNVTGKALAADVQLNGEYWANHIRQAVRFSECVDAAAELGCGVILELGPQSVLTRMAAANWNRPPGSLISCLQKGASDSQSILKAVGQLYVQGSTPDFDAMYESKKHRRVLLPTYPFQRRRFWGPDKPRAFHAEYHTAHPLLGSKVSLAGLEKETRYESFVEPDSPPWLPDHEVMGNVVLPGAAFVEMAIAAAGSDQIEDLVFEQPLRPTSRTALQTVIRTGDEHSKNLETYSCSAEATGWIRNFSAKIVTATSGRPGPIDRSALELVCTETVATTDFYQKMLDLGLNYGPKFQTIDSIQYSADEVLSRLTTHGDVRGFSIPPTLLDGALHSLAVGLLRNNDDQLFLPIGMGRVRCWQSVENEVWCHAKWKQNEGKIRTADLVLFNESGQVVAEIEQLKVQQVSVAALRQMSGSGAERLVYELDWQVARLPAAKTENKTWLIVSQVDDAAADPASTGQQPAARRLKDQLVEQGHKVVELILSAGTEFEEDSVRQFRMCAESEENWLSLLDRLSDKDDPILPDGITWFLGDREAVHASSERSDGSATRRAIGPTTKTNCIGLLKLIAALQNRERRQLECGLLLITSDAIATGTELNLSPEQTQYWGLGRVIGAEQPDLRCRLLDVASAEQQDPETAAAILDVMLTETRDNQLAVREGQFFVPRMKKASIKKQKQTAFAANPDGCYLITGGLGMLGRQAAKWLAENGAGQVVLVSRRVPDPETQSFLDSVSETGCDVVVHPADLSSPDDVSQLFQRFGSELKSLSGVIHAAGVLDDALVGDQNWGRFEKVLAPKVVGATLLHEYTQTLDLEFFILYSSAASVLGSPGQSNYATANAYLDGLAWHRRSRGLPAVSVNWGPWTEGMADDERIIKRLALQGITPLTISEAHAALEGILAADVVQATVIDADWRRMRMGLGGESPAMMEHLAPARQRSQQGDSELVSKLKQLRGSAPRELLLKTVQGSLQAILSTPDAPETDRPLIEMGLDSLMAVEFGTELQQMLGDQFAVGPTMLFDHPTIDAITDHVLELVTSDTESQPAPEQDELRDLTEKTLRTREDVAIIGMSCRFPGAQNTDEFWQNLMNGVDSVCEIPGDRWDIDRFYDADREPGKMYTKEGGFLSDIADFDAAFFNIADQEACWIDPQHRMLLENSYRALEDAGISPHPLHDANVGVFMGIMGQDYAFLPTLDDIEVIKAFQGAGLSHSAGVGRISYVFGFEGPSVAVDTASSSSLVALYQAVRSLQDGNCNMALAGGVNAILAPVNSLLMSKAGLLSPDGRCKSFSANADGFGRGEGCGVVVLKRLSDAQRDGDRIMAVVRGGAVVHNGFSSGITAPSGKSQARVIAEALKDAGVAPSQVQYLEAHGTGTEYGDPVELGAVASTYGKGRKPDQPLLVGSVKANISHLEAAGGVSGLIKTVLALHHGVIPPQANFDQPSPHIPWQRMPVKMVVEPTKWPETDCRVAGVTALGLVGTNAHVILSSPPPIDSTDSMNEETGETLEGFEVVGSQQQLLVVSARNESALKQLTEDYQNFLQRHPDTDLADICYTASVGRRHFEHRIAVTSQSIAETDKKLGWLFGGESSSQNGQPTQNGSANGVAPKNLIATDVARGMIKRTPKIGWVFGKGWESNPLWLQAAARELYASQPVVRDLFQAFDQRLNDYLKQNERPLFQLRDWIRDGETVTPRLQGVPEFAIQAGLAQTWRSLGVEPDVVLGFGLGQYTAACLAGGLCFQDALVLVAERDNVLQGLASKPQTSHGEPPFEQKPDEESDSLLRKFETLADGFNYYPPNLPLICSVTGEVVPVHRALGGSFWRQHCLTQPLLQESANQLAKMECDFVLEFGSMVSVMPETHGTETVRIIRTMEKGQSVTNSLLYGLGELYVGGVNPNFEALYRHRKSKRIGLPNYPFQKKRYWITEIADYADPQIETVVH